MSQNRWSYICDYCEKIAQHGDSRISCIVCSDYDLCEECYRKKRVNLEHQAFHPMLVIPAPMELDENLAHKLPDQIKIFRCPNCGDGNLGVQELAAHCLEYHSYSSCKVRCPICVTFQIHGNWITEDTLLLHLLSKHHDKSGFGSIGSRRISECSICVEEMSVGNNRELECGHSFHRACINTWLQENNNCPMCRAEINE